MERDNKKKKRMQVRFIIVLMKMAPKPQITPSRITKNFPKTKRPLVQPKSGFRTPECKITHSFVHNEN